MDWSAACDYGIHRMAFPGHAHLPFHIICLSAVPSCLCFFKKNTYNLQEVVFGPCYTVLSFVIISRCRGRDLELNLFNCVLAVIRLLVFCDPYLP